MRHYLEAFKNSAFSLLFPPICLHCQVGLGESASLLCGACFQKLELLDPQNRCRGCFCPCEEPLCHKCHEGKILASCFAYEEVAKSLLLALKYEQLPHLAKALASFMYLQLDRLNWPLADLITFIPQSFLRARVRGYNQSELLALELGELIQRPVEGLFRKPHFSISQTLLTQEDRLALSEESFRLKTKTLPAQKILLIDDVHTTGATLEVASKLLKEAGALQVYAFTFALAEMV